MRSNQRKEKERCCFFSIVFFSPPCSVHKRLFDKGTCWFLFDYHLANTWSSTTERNLPYDQIDFSCPREITRRLACISRKCSMTREHQPIMTWKREEYKRTSFKLFWCYSSASKWMKPVSSESIVSKTQRFLLLLLLVFLLAQYTSMECIIYFR